MRVGCPLRRLAGVTLIVASAVCVSAQSEDQVVAFLRSHQMDLGDGRSFLIDEGRRATRDANLLYWADSYDAIVCHREVTPLCGPRP